MHVIFEEQSRRSVDHKLPAVAPEISISQFGGNKRLKVFVLK